MTSHKLVGMVYNPDVAEAANILADLVDSLGLHRRCWSSSVDSTEEIREKLDKTSLIVVAGGDGTILRTVRISAPFDVPIVGINLGRIGFMTELKVEEAVEKLPDYLEGNMRVEERMMLEATVTSGSERRPRMKLQALNEVVMGRGSVARLHDINTTVDGEPLANYRADAVIVSTATGSTGYALSAGGSIIYPEARIVLVQPVAAHIGLRDGLVLPEESVIELTLNDGHPGMLSVDGFLDSSMNANDTVTIKRGPHMARFLRADPPSSFYASLTRRLGLAARLSPGLQDM